MNTTENKLQYAQKYHMLWVNRTDHEYYRKQVVECTETPHAPGEPH